MGDHSEVVSILRDLIRLDTSNPPGREKPAADYIAGLLSREGIDFTLVEPAPGRSNIVARLKGDGSKAPLLLSAHLDVVPASPAGWAFPPFSAQVHDGYIWGRGAVDMKHMAAMSLVVLLELKRKGTALSRDVIFAGVADEEAGGKWGAGHLVDHRPDLIKAEYALTELGGMSIASGGTDVIPVQVAEKGNVWFKLRARGRAGHASLPDPESAVARLARAVDALSGGPLGYRLTDPARTFLTALAATRLPPASTALKGLMSERTAGLALRFFPAEKRRVFSAMLHNTVSVTALSAGGRAQDFGGGTSSREGSVGAPNVSPEVAEARADGRYLPGVSQEEFLRQVRAAVGEGVEIEVEQAGPPVESPASGPLLDAIGRVMARRLPKARVVPYLIPGMTDARHYRRAGITTYGFAPVALKPDEPFAALYHAQDERISIAGLEAGLSWLHDLVVEFCSAEKA